METKLGPFSNVLVITIWRSKSARRCFACRRISQRVLRLVNGCAHRAFWYSKNTRTLMMRSLPVLLAGLSFGLVGGLHAVEVGLIKVKGVIGPATSSYISRAIDKAGERKFACLVILLDTPGGALDATKEIVQKFYASTVPTVVYVAPAGSWAGSAGCFITLAADVAAMAPSTSIGAAHPVSIFPGVGDSTNSVMKEKIENLAGSYIVSIAKKRGRNAEWAKSSVINRQALSATEALKTNVIN